MNTHRHIFTTEITEGAEAGDQISKHSGGVESRHAVEHGSETPEKTETLPGAVNPHPDGCRDCRNNCTGSVQPNEDRFAGSVEDSRGSVRPAVTILGEEESLLRSPRRRKGKPGGARVRATAHTLRKDVRVCSSAGTAGIFFERSDVEEAERIRLECRFLHEVGRACQVWLEKRGLAVPSWFERRMNGEETGV